MKTKYSYLYLNFILGIIAIYAIAGDSFIEFPPPRYRRKLY